MSKIKIEFTPEQIRQIATRKAMGSSLREIETEFGISRPVLNRALSTDISKAVMKGLADDATQAAVTEAKQAAAKLLPLWLEALEHQLREKNMEAVKAYPKYIGLDSGDTKDQKQQQVIQVTLPRAARPKDIEN